MSEPGLPPTLCRTCHHRRDIVSGTGSRFVLCELSLTDPRFAKYPPQPLFRCAGYQAAATQVKENE
ncbi:hypothetical protein [Symmachiella macrocystis]|uniref:hypothetical protein n=1 Tax=Symmachiella macrocystis TaxID=2527985 RepID=UPI0011B6C4C9|nr:hypothetical protein [Symmachiella macrocystis]